MARSRRGANGGCPMSKQLLLACLFILLLGSSPFDAAAQDADGDSIPDIDDNCPFTPNVNQMDVGGLGYAGPDGIGDACQCGDVTGDGVVNSTDATFIKRQSLFLSAPLFNVPGNCDASCLTR